MAYYSINVNGNIVGIDLSRVKKIGFLKKEGLVLKKPTVLVYFDGSDKPEFSFEFNNYSDAEHLYYKIESKLKEYLDEETDKKIKNLTKELELIKEQNNILKETVNNLKIITKEFSKMIESLVETEEVSDLLQKIEDL